MRFALQRMRAHGKNLCKGRPDLYGVKRIFIENDEDTKKGKHLITLYDKWDAAIKSNDLKNFQHVQNQVMTELQTPRFSF